MKSILFVLAALATAALMFWYWQKPGEVAAARPPPTVPVSVYTATMQDFSDQVRALGTLRAWESVDISASVAQQITRLYFEDGQQVEKGDVLALLKQDEEQATLRELKASLFDARREVGRLQNLAEKNQVAQNELDRAGTLVEITSHRISEIEARIADRTIVAPFSGLLGLRLVSEGAQVTAGQRLTTLDDTGRMRLEFSVPSTRLDYLQIGLQVTARAAGSSEEHTGIVTAIDSRVDPVSRSIAARAELPNPSGLLRPGLLMEVTLQSAPRQALLVPEESLLSRGNKHYIWRVQDDTAQRVTADIGGRTPGWVEIVQGLQPGDAIVRDGVGNLSGDAVPVSVVGE